MHLPSHPHRPCIQLCLLERHPQHLLNHHHPRDACGCSFHCEFTQARPCIEPLLVLCHCVCAVVVILLEAWKDAHAPRCARAAAPSLCTCMLGSVGLWRRCVCPSVWTMEPPEDGRISQLFPTPSRGVLRCHCCKATIRLPRLLHEPTSTSLLYLFVSLPLSFPTWCVHAHHVSMAVPRDRAACVMWWNPDSLQRNRRVARRRRRRRHGPVRVVRQSYAYQGRRDETKRNGCEGGEGKHAPEPRGIDPSGS